MNYNSTQFKTKRGYRYLMDENTTPLYVALGDFFTSFGIKVRDTYREYMHNIGLYPKGWNESISSISRESISSIKRWSNELKHKIDFVDEDDYTGLYKYDPIGFHDPSLITELVQENTLTTYQSSYRYYNPETNSMTNLTPAMGFRAPLIRSRFNYIRDILSLKSVAPLRFGELSLERILWSNLKKSSDLLNNRMTQKLTHSLIHFVTFQSRDDMTYVYGSFFAIGFRWLINTLILPAQKI